MEARAGNSILDFETLFSGFRELLNGSGLSQVSRQPEVGNTNSALSTPDHHLVILRELSQCPRALTEIIIPNQLRKMNIDMFLVPVQKKGWKINHHVSIRHGEIADF